MDLINILADVNATLCSGETKPLFIFIGNVVTGIKIIVPILLIIFGSIDLAKAVIAQKDDDIKKATSTLMKRAIVAVVIFFLPSILSMILSLTGESDAKTGGNNCWQCVVNPGKC